MTCYDKPKRELVVPKLQTRAVEDYTKIIYTIAERGDSPTTNAIATELGVRPASVTGMLRKLAEMKLIRYEPYQPVALTDAGRRIALEVIRHHRLIETFLSEALGMSWDEVHDEAEVLEHAISERLEDRIAEMLGHPEFDPHGDPIPRRDGSIARRDLIPLAACQPGDAVRIARVRRQDAEALQYLGSLGLRPGAAVRVRDKAPLDGPLTLELDDRSRVVLAHHLAETVMAETGNVA